MSFTRQELGEVFHRSGGRCHACGKAFVFAKYGHFGRLGEWELDHVKSMPEDEIDKDWPSPCHGAFLSGPWHAVVEFEQVPLDIGGFRRRYGVRTCSGAVSGLRQACSRRNRVEPGMG